MFYLYVSFCRCNLIAFSRKMRHKVLFFYLSVCKILNLKLSNNICWGQVLMYINVARLTFKMLCGTYRLQVSCHFLNVQNYCIKVKLLFDSSLI